MRLLGLGGLAACAALSLVIALWPQGDDGRDQPQARPTARTVLAVTLAALAVRALFSLVQDGGTYDIFNAYRFVGDHLRHGHDVFVEPALGLSNYPPVIYWWWAAAASLVPSGHPHLFAAVVRAPFWIVDAAIAPVLLLCISEARLRLRAAWLYALSPVAIAVPTLHGQFDPLVALPLLLAVVLVARRPRAARPGHALDGCIHPDSPISASAPAVLARVHRVRVVAVLVASLTSSARPAHPHEADRDGLLGAGLLVGVAAAFKPWPFFFLGPLLAQVPRRLWMLFVAAMVAPTVAAFASYALVHPDHVLAGVNRVITYAAHRQGLGTSHLFAEKTPQGVITAANLVAGALATAVGVLAARRRWPAADAMAAAMLVLLAVSPTVSDQYLMWPLPFLLLGGRLRLAAALAVALLPAVASTDLWVSQGDGQLPIPLAALATLSMAAAAAHLIWQGLARTADPAALPSTPGAARRAVITG